MSDIAHKLLRSRINELQEKIREQEGLARALQAGEVDAVVVLQGDEAKLSVLKSDEPLYRTIIDKLPQGVATVLSDGTIVYLNDQLANSIGEPADTLRGKNLLTSFVGADRPLVGTMLQRAITEPQELEATFQRVGGEAPVLVSAIRLPISGVDTLGVVIVDLTDQLARREAEESSRAKDELIASVSHELRTPLTSIMGWVQLLEMELEHDEHFKQSLKHMKNAVLAEMKIVDDLLDLSRSEKGSLAIAQRQFDLRDPIRMATSFVELQAQTKSVALQIDIPQREIEVRGDPDRLRQVFVNLLSNAVKFTAEGQVRVSAMLDGDAVTVEVADSGMGISPEFIPMVFEPFRRSPRAERYPGLGIGLAISRRIVEAHGGTITAHSEGPGMGATFTVTLPVV